MGKLILFTLADRYFTVNSDNWMFFRRLMFSNEGKVPEYYSGWFQIFFHCGLDENKDWFRLFSKENGKKAKFNYQQVQPVQKNFKVLKNTKESPPPPYVVFCYWETKNFPIKIKIASLLYQIYSKTEIFKTPKESPTFFR